MSGFNSTTTSTASDLPTTTSQAQSLTVTSQQDNGQVTATPVIVTEFSTYQYTPSATRASTSSARPSASTTSDSAALSSDHSSGGLSKGGTIGIAVAVPVVVVALLAVLGLFLWRKRKRNQDNLAQRKEEQDQYSFHPSTNTTTSGPVMAQNTYRGWQPTNMTHQPSATNNSGFQLGRGGSNADTLALAAAPVTSARRTSSNAPLERPTIPAFGLSDDLDSVIAPSPRNSHYGLVTSPGNGSPPLDAFESGSPSSDYSEPVQARSDTANFVGPAQTLRSSGMASFMPALQPGYERQPRFAKGSPRTEF